MGGYYYTTSQGDMWDAIAYMVYGDERKVDILYEANPRYIGELIFDAGIKIWCPEVDEDSEDENVPDWRDDEDADEE